MLAPKTCALEEKTMLYLSQYFSAIDKPKTDLVSMALYMSETKKFLSLILLHQLQVAQGLKTVHTLCLGKKKKTKTKTKTKNKNPGQQTQKT